MTGMDWIPAEQPRTSVMKGRALQELIKSPNPEGSGRKKTLNLSCLGQDVWPTVPRDQFKASQLGRPFDASHHIFSLDSLRAQSL